MSLSPAAGIGALLSLAPEPELKIRRARQTPRHPLRSLGAMRRSGGSAIGVQILDLSTHGFQVETHLELSPGDSLWIRLPGLESRHARIAWKRHARYGCAFVEPLHTAVLSMIVDRL